MKLLRSGEARGHYDQVVQTLNASGPRGGQPGMRDAAWAGIIG